MADTAADVLIDTIHDWGVEVVFGLPGDGINGIMEALRDAPGRRSASSRCATRRRPRFMACAYAKYTGRLGVCLATSGPGGIHLLNGLYDAKLDGQPVLAITGHHYHDLIDTHAQQDVDLDRVFADVAVYNTRVMGAGARRERRRPRLPHGARATAASRTSTSPSISRSRRAASARKRNVPGPHLRRLRPQRAACRPRRTCAAPPRS